nr:uncharacterized protein LOC105338290 [Crassostrea gigas]
MSSTNIGLLMVFSVFINRVFTLTLETEDVLFQKNDSIVLNCTWHMDSMEDISFYGAIWQKKIGNEFINIAVVSSRGVWLFDGWNMQPYYRNRAEPITPNTLPSAAMIIKDPVCSDQGVYKCWIKYSSYSNEFDQTSSRSIVTFKAEAREPEMFLMFPYESEENHSITLTCNADVGSPQGTIMIWKMFQNKDISVLLYVSNTTTNKTESCTEFVSINITYTVTRDDNGAVFRCSSQNNFTQRPGPHRDSSKILVIYGPDESAIILTPSKSSYDVGDPLTMMCIADSNPPPVFGWSFRPYNTSNETLVEHVHFHSKLVFHSLQTTDSGTYICTATNSARPNYPNASSSVSLYIKHSESYYNGCKKCGYLRTCQRYNRDTVCVINVWAAIAIVFLIIFVSFAVITILLIVNKNNRSKCITSSNRVHSQSVPQNDTGYQTHADFANTHVYSSLQSHKPETGQYTSLQSKKPETSEFTSLQSQKLETDEYTSLQSQKPETGEYTSLQSHNPDIGEYTPLQLQKPKTGEHILLQTKKPETGDHTSLPSHTPETSEYTSMQSHKQETAEYISLQSHNLETSEYTSLQSHELETAEYTSLQSYKPETAEYTSLQSHKQETAEYTSLQSHNLETAEYTSLQSHELETAEYTSLQSYKPETGEYTSLQSHKQETAEYTTIDNVS